MKIAVITRHAISNYGSLLQAMATQQIIEKLGHSCEIIDYVRIDENYRNHEKTLLKRKVEWNNNIVKKVLYLAIRQPESIIAGKRFEMEQKRYLNLTERYVNVDEIKKNPPIADVYMTGSDQVWGPVENGSYDSVYCLSFTDKKKVSYAASFGHNELTLETKKYYKQWLSKYDYITVRESNAVDLLEQIGIYSEQVIDPTLLFDADYWNKFIKPIKYKDYILVYQLHNDKKLFEYAREASMKLGLPVIRVSSSLHQVNRGGKFIFCPSVGEFLSYIKNARFMITDSFHGTAFAINFNTQFVEVLPSNGTSTRNISILQQTRLTNRIITQNNRTVFNDKIDFEEVNVLIKELRHNSVSILKDMLEE